MMRERNGVEPVEMDEVREAVEPPEARKLVGRKNGHEPVVSSNGREPVMPREAWEAAPRAESREQSNMDILVGYVLAGGVITSMVLIAAGLIWHWATTGSLGLEYTMGGTNFFRFVISDVATIIRTGLGPRRMINLGIAVLMLTPFARVVSSMLYFAVVEHNWKYTAFTGFVLAVLTYSLFLR